MTRTTTPQNTDRQDIASKFAGHSAAGQMPSFDFLEDTRGGMDTGMSERMTGAMKNVVQNPEDIRTSMAHEINLAAYRETRKLAEVTASGPALTQAQQSIENWRMEAQEALQTTDESVLVYTKIDKMMNACGGQKHVADIQSLTQPSARLKTTTANPKRFFPKKGMKG